MTRTHRPVAVVAGGFTLTEMLIIICILGLLAALVVPVIFGVVELAKELACRTNLGAISVALKAYTAESKCFPYICQRTRPGGDMYYEYWYYWTDYVIFSNDGAMRNDGNMIGWTNLGMLWSPKADSNPNVPEGKYIKNEDNFFCPQFYRKNEPFELGLGGDPWPPGRDPQGNWVKTKSTYSRRPACAGKGPCDIPGGVAVAADYFPRSWYYAQLPQHVHRRMEGFNVAYYDGSVRWFDDPTGIALDPANFVGNNYMDSARRTEQSWQELDRQDAPWPANAYLK